jgi:hypothetical protein
VERVRVIATISRQKLKRFIQLQYQAGLTDDRFGGAHAVVKKQRPRSERFGRLVAGDHPVGIDVSNEDNDETAVN